jgi:hypothetical protein
MRLTFVSAFGAAIAASCIAVAPAQAHDFSVEIAKFRATAEKKNMDSPDGVAAVVALERAQGEIEQADVRMLLRIRSMTNNALKALGDQPAFLTSEIKRLEAAMASPKTADPAKIAEAKAIYARLVVEKKAYDALDKSAGEQMNTALKLVETAPVK